MSVCVFISVCLSVCVVSPNLRGLWSHLAVFIAPRIFVTRLTRSLCSFCLFDSLIFFSFSMRSVSYEEGLRNHLDFCPSPPHNFFFFCTVHIISKERTRLVLPKISFICKERKFDGFKVEVCLMNSQFRCR